MAKRRFSRFSKMHCSTITENEGNNDDEKSLSKPTAKNGKNSRLDQPTAHMPGEQPLIWRNIIGIAGLHLIAIYLFVTRYHTAKMATWIFGTVIFLFFFSLPNSVKHVKRKMEKNFKFLQI